MAHLERHEVSFATDPSNLDPKYLRTRVRTELLPLLSKLSPTIVDHLTALAEELGRKLEVERGGDADEPELPEILDEAGQPVSLSRAHREQLRRALRYQQFSTRVLLPGNRVIVLDPDSGQPRLETAENRSN